MKNKPTTYKFSLALLILSIFTVCFFSISCEDTLTSGIQEQVRLAIIPNFTLIIQAPSTGSVTPVGTVTLKQYETVTVAASVPAGYSFVNWEIIDGAANILITNAFAATTTVQLTSGNAIILPIFSNTLPPTGSISINAEATYTTSISCVLTTTATALNGSTLTHMIISENSSFTGASWETYATSKNYSLTAVDGLKTVYIKYKDSSGNVSITYSDTITLDRGIPTGSISIESGAAGTKVLNVSLTIAGTDALSTVTQMKISNSSTLTGASWGTFNPAVSNWPMAAGSDGTRTVYVKFKDGAGNESSNYSDSIKYDTTGPTGTINIQGGVAYYQFGYPVTLNNTASDGSGVGVTQMMIANNSLFTGAGIVWETFTATRNNWTLETGYGDKTVYIKYRDSLNNESSTISDTIRIDDDYEGSSGNVGTAAAYDLQLHHQGWGDINNPPSTVKLSDQELSGYAVSGDSDYYKFAVGTGIEYGKLTVRAVDKSGGSAGLSVRLYGAYSTSTAYQSGGYAETIYNPAGSIVSGTYYIIVESNNGYTFESYDLEVYFAEYTGM